jgi:hypothetical protein
VGLLRVPCEAFAIFAVRVLFYRKGREEILRPEQNRSKLLRSMGLRWYKMEIVESSVAKAGRFIRISRRSSGI